MKQNFTQPGNPHNLTVDQHIFPRFCIQRFTNSKGEVEYFDKTRSKSINLNPKNHRFCGKRIWNERAENGHMKSIEDDYLKIINRVYHLITYNLQPDDREIITSMFLLWSFRQNRKMNPIPDQKLNGVLSNSLSSTLSVDQKEQAEKKWVTVINNNGTVDGRDLTGDNIQLQIMHYKKQYAGMKWGILHSKNIEFIVPDTFADIAVLPFSPHMCFVLNFESGLVTDDHVEQINKIAISKSKNYYFARDLSQCFIDNSPRQD